MRRLVVLLLLAGFVLQAWASKRVSVAQLEQTLSAAHGSPDAAVAQQLSGLELTERLSPTRFARLKADLPGEKAREALTLLADSSAFLDLPVAEIPATPTPDPAAQRQMMALEPVINLVGSSTESTSCGGLALYAFVLQVLWNQQLAEKLITGSSRSLCDQDRSSVAEFLRDPEYNPF